MFSIGVAITVALAAATTASAWVHLDKSIIPVVKIPLPVLSLGPPAVIPDEILQLFINASSPNVTLVTNRTTGDKEAYDGERLVAFVNASTGETGVFPDLSILQPARDGINTTLAQFYLSLNQSFPHDHTNSTLIPGANLVGSRFHNHSRQDTPEVYLTHTLVQRSILVGDQSFPVCGPGSQASFGFGHDGYVRSLSYQWKPAELTQQYIKSNSTAQVYKAILAALEPLGRATNGTILVDHVEVCIYDSGKNFLQPVFHFTGIFRSGIKVTTSQTRLDGYLPFGSGSPEGLPGLNDKPTTNPTDGKDQVITLSTRGVQPQIRVGRYVVRDDASAWVDNANNFWNNLHTSSSANFINQQYYWAEPRLFLNQKNSFINSVHIAETEVHGNYHLFTTEKNCCDVVYLDDVPSPGYGGNAGGSLAYWILHSCEVIPTIVDYPSGSRASWDVWWDIFDGMRAAVGYRTDMYIADNVMPRFGNAIARGAPFVMTWLQTVHDDGIYKRNGKDIMYYDSNQRKDQPMGRASAVVVCGHENDLAWQVDNLGKPSCLRQYWYNN